MQKRQIILNAVMSISQVLIISAVLFFLYRFLIKSIGVAQLGIWSLVLATTSVTQIANFGLSGSVVKFVAKYMAREDRENVSKVIQTAALSVAILIGVILLALYPVIKWILGLVIPSGSFSLALEILPVSLLSLWILMIAGVFNAGLDGCQCIYLRNAAYIGGTFLFLALCLIFVPKYGLMGLAYSQGIQNSAILWSSWQMLRKHISGLPFVPYRWDKKIFKEIVGYGLNFQIMSISIMFYDPVTKALLGKFGGLSVVGYYEMANRMIQQFRALIISANQVLVPAIADLHERMPERIRMLYLTSYQLLFFLSLPLFTFIIISSPTISEIWIGHYESAFTLPATLLSIGWFLNTLNVPAYVANLGTGELRWNLIGHLTIAVLNAGIGFLCGMAYGGTGVIVGWVISLAVGSSLIYLTYHLRHRIPLADLIPKASRLTAAVCLIIVAASFVIQNRLNGTGNLLLVSRVIVLLSSITIGVIMWLHPMRKRLRGWISNELVKKPSF